jgi:hypothetical protein
VAPGTVGLSARLLGIFGLAQALRANAKPITVRGMILFIAGFPLRVKFLVDSHHSQLWNHQDGSVGLTVVDDRERAVRRFLYLGYHGQVP